ncbi:helix-turn-helix domain-containing protein [Hanstruepera ponticola]|uniref:helix-turn-helix domain-containing protein n=1 Tax=Hanstruepera ponticola TaxID=2042995 RepID=UPI000CF0DDC3|nr:helix-turn-helix transcriptional regulator [Hanstruepera ponticola]
MNFDSQIIFFFSALGAFNGFILAIYFAVIAEKKKFSNYFLALLLLVLSIRIIKSVFYFFNPGLSGVFIQIGLSACILIGPFLYLYLKSQTTQKTKAWTVHVLPYLIGITLLGISYPYIEHRPIWSRYIVRGIYLQWLVYIVLSFKYVKPLFKIAFEKKDRLKSIEIWLLSIFSGVSVIWFAYNIASYTSYIVGALSFSFVMYLIVLLFVFRNKKEATFFEEKEKYKNNKIDAKIVALIATRIKQVKEQGLYLNPKITLASTAKELHISKHQLSQFLNNNLNKSFSVFINELRIEKAKELLKSTNQYTIEGIGYECGFNSKSTFHTTFKKVTGQTPSDYQKSLAK